jgi:AcrR family transcriptional regulator
MVVLYGTSAVKERVMAGRSVSKRRQEGGDETAVRERILEAAFAAFMKSGYATASTLEIATRARVSKRELYALVGNKQKMLIACIRGRAKRFDVPADLPVLRDRETLALVLASFGTKLVREASDPTVIAVFRLAISEVIHAPDVSACARLYSTRDQPRRLARNHGPSPGVRTAHRTSCRTCQAVRRAALARFTG